MLQANYKIYIILKAAILNSLKECANSLNEELVFISKVGDPSQGWPEGSLFDSYYTEV